MISISKSNRFPSLAGEGLGVRSNLTKRQIEVTMFAVGFATLDNIKFD